MRQLAATLGVMAALACGSAAFSAPAPPDVSGFWKLVALPFGTDDFLIVDVKPGDKHEAKVLSTQTMIGERTAQVKIDGEVIQVDFPGKGVPLSFRGKLAPDGKILGSIKYSTATYPARLEKTTAEKVDAMKPAAFRTGLTAALRETDAKAKGEKLAKVLEELGDQPAASTVYPMYLGLAESLGLSADDVRKHVEKWSNDAKPYGAEWASEVRTRALKALQGKKGYADLATELAVASEAALAADADLTSRASIAGLLATSARLAGKTELAAKTEARLKEYDAKLDAEYHEKVPPFKLATFEGRKDGKGNRSVVMEIFTGAECPPCVAADVGFDALLKTYKPTEFIGLQYHLHIPGPDPLTNDFSEARQKYYGTEVRGTPSTFFNGKSAAGGGGGMDRSEVKYGEFRGQIDPALSETRKAEITVEARRVGDELEIVAKATADSAAKDAKPHLRLVLVEESVRYPGGNKLRFHHNVVRAFPGGVGGKALEDGKTTFEVKMKLADLRKAQEEYLAKFPKSSGRSFPNPLPPIDLDDLAVVALVQDDADHAVWHGVQVPVKVVNP